MATLRVRIICLGNPLMLDDGVGIKIAKVFNEMKLPEGVDVIEGGVAGVDILDMVMGVHKVVFVDAICTGGTPGTVQRFDLKKLIEECTSTSLEERLAHSLDLLAALKIGYTVFPEKMPEEVVLIGVEVKDRGSGVGLSKEVQEAIPKIVEKVLNEVEISLKF